MLTVVIPTFNEAFRIRDAVDALRWTSQVIVVDGGSTDGTPESARKAGALVIERARMTIGEQRNAGIALAKHEWVLALDADERVSPALLPEIEEALRSERFDAYSIPFREFFAGRELTFGSYGRHHKVRLFRQRHRFSTVRAHEKLEHVCRVGALRGAVMHEGCRDMHDQLRKMLLYSRWAADDMYARDRRASAADLAFRPLWRFIREFFVFGAWRGGVFGFQLSAMSAISAFVKYGLLWMRRDEDRRSRRGELAGGQLEPRHRSTAQERAAGTAAIGWMSRDAE